MANDYYDNSDDLQRFQPGERIRASDVDAKFDQVQQGFARLPALAASGKGFSEAINIGSATQSGHAMTYGQVMAKVAEWANAQPYSATAEYAFGAVVIGSDGITYRFVGSTAATGDDPVTSETDNWSAYGGGGTKTLGTLTASVTNGETRSITLDDEIEMPVVTVLKEVVDTGLTNSDWNVAADGSNYDAEDFAYNTTIQPSGTSGSITLSLGAGVFEAGDVGKRIIFNGGEAVLLNTDGTAIVRSAFNSTSAVMPGEWVMTGVDFGSPGVAITKESNPYDVAQVAGVVQFTSLSNNNATPSVAVNSNSTRVFAIDNNGTHVYQYNLSSAGDLDTLSYSGKSLDISSVVSAVRGLAVSPSGDKLYVHNTGTVYQWSLSSAGEIDSAAYDSKTGNLIDGLAVNIASLYVSQNGFAMYTSNTNDRRVYRYTLSSAFEVDTLARDSGYIESPAGFYPNSVMCSIDEDKVYIADYAYQSAAYLREYTSFTPGDISSYELENSANLELYLGSLYMPKGLIDINSGTSFGVIDGDTGSLMKGSLGQIAVSTNEYIPIVSKTSIDTRFWYGVNGMSAMESKNGQQIYYAISSDNQLTFRVVKSGSGSRAIVRKSAGVWEYNSDNTYVNNTWTIASRNSVFGALSDAMSIPTNRMDSAQLSAAGSADFPVTTDTLDLAIILYSDTLSDVPSSDGLLINYDANAIYTGAVPGTDYEWDHPDSTTVRIHALADMNIKTRVI